MGITDANQFQRKYYYQYSIGHNSAKSEKVASIATVVRESIVDEQENTENMTTKEKRILLVMRILANLLVAGVIAGAIGIITWRTIATTKTADSSNQPVVVKTAKPNWFQQNELSLDITAITMLAPSLFELIALMEKYHPRTALRIQLGRLLMLYIVKGSTTIIFDAIYGCDIPFKLHLRQCCTVSC